MTFIMEHRHEAQQLERLTFFSDAVFAIAMTLLVIEVRVPELHHATEGALGQALLDLLPKYIGFVISFVVVGRFWVGHHRIMGLLRASDARLVWTNLFLLLTVAFMPFPTAVLSEYTSLKVAIGFYAAWLTLIGLMNHRLVMVALGDRRLVRDDVDDAARAAVRRSSWAPVVIGAAAFAFGLIHPLLALAGLMLGSFVVIRLLQPRAVEVSED